MTFKILPRSIIALFLCFVLLEGEIVHATTTEIQGDLVEWNQDQSRIIVEGNAQAQRGTMTLTAHRLEGILVPGGKVGNFERVQAFQNVRVFSRDVEILGAKGVYFPEKQRVEMTGNPVYLKSESYTLTCPRLTYHVGRSVAHTFGKTEVRQNGNYLSSQALKLVFRGGTRKRGQLASIQSSTRTELKIKEALIRGDSLNYDTKNFVFEGRVSITNPRGRLEAARAIYNLETRSLKTYGSASKPVHALIFSDTGKKSVTKKR